MSNLVDLEKHRLRLYGEMLKNDLTERRNQEKIQKQTILKRDSLDLQRHIQNTRKMDLSKKLELKQLNNALKEDNMMLSTFKKDINFGKTYAEQGQNFINQIHDMDSRRLSRLKGDLVKQFHDNKDFSSNKRFIEDKIKEIQKLQAERHTNRVKQMQLESVRNYEDIKKKHQQDMHLYERHKRLVEENQNYRDQIESFTNVKAGIFDRFNRNEHFQRRITLRENQDQIMKQIEQFERKKRQDNIEYKRKVGDLQDSMLANILSKPQRYEPRAYSNELRNQIQEDNLKKMEENNTKRQKIQLNNIYGGVHGNQREKMMKIIDRGLGIDRYSQSSLVKPTPKRPGSQLKNQSALQNNPQLKLSESQRYPTPKDKGKRQQQDYSQQYTPSNAENNQLVQKDYAKSQVSNTSSQNRRYYKSYDLIAGKNKFYGAE